MHFSESDLVDMALGNGIDGFHPLLQRRKFRGRPYRGHLCVVREHKLESQRRCDVIIKNKNCWRRLWLIEFKIRADASAITQILEYAEELLWEHDYPVLTATIAAQFFDPQVIYLCGFLGIQCLHISPVNAKSLSFKDLTAHHFAQKRDWGGRG